MTDLGKPCQPRLTLELALRPVPELNDFQSCQSEFLHQMVDRYAPLAHPKNVRFFASQVKGLVVSHTSIYDRKRQLPVRAGQIR